MIRISIEWKDGKFTVQYGKMRAVGATPQAAVEALVAEFRKEVERFFIIAK